MRHARSRLTWVLIVAAACWGVVLFARADDTPSWLEDITVSDGEKRQAAIESLAATGTKLTDDLIAELAVDHPPLAISAMAEVLSGMKLSSGEVAKVVSLLSSRSPATRYAVVRVLGEHASTAAKSLAAVAEDAEEPVALRAAACAALAGGGSVGEGALKALARDEDAPGALRQAAIRAWAEASSTGAEAAVKIAGDLDEPWLVRLAAIDALGGADVTLPSTAKDLLSSKEARVRAQMVRALIDRDDADALATIAKATGDTDATTRLVALQGVDYYQGLVTHRSALLLRLSDTDPRVRALAAEAVGRTCSDAKTTVVPKLKPLLASTNFHVRHAAAMALLGLQDKSGQATMKADAVSTNRSQAARATAAYDAIRLARW